MSETDDEPAADKAAEVALPAELIQQRIRMIRGHKVMVDTDLAVLYETETRLVVRAVQRNRARFPNDFMFQLDADEFEALRSQTGISKIEAPPGRGGRRTLP